MAPLNRFKPSSKIFYWPFQGGTSFVDLLFFCSVLCLLCFVRVCLYVLRGHLLGKGWPLGSRLWCLLWVCHFPIGILGQVWYLIVSIPDLCNLTYLGSTKTRRKIFNCGFYSPSVLHNADFRRASPKACKTSSKTFENDVASLTSPLTPAIVCTSSILSLLKFVFICWCAYNLTLTSTQML